MAFSGVLSQVGFLMIFGVHKYLILRNGAGTYVAASADSRRLLTARRAKDLDVTEFMRVVTHRRMFNPPSTVARATAFIEGIGDAPSCKVVRPGPKFLELLIAVSCQADSRGNLMFLARCSQVRWSGVVDSASTLAPG